MRHLLVLACVMAARPAHADTPVQPAPRSAAGGGFEFYSAPATDVYNSVRPASGTQWGLGVTVGGIVSLRWRLLRVGVVGDVSALPFLPTLARLGVVIGSSWEPRTGLRLDLLAEGGVDEISNVGNDLLAPTTAGPNSALLPYAGLRAGIAYRFGKERHGIVGAWLSFREDLMRTTINQTQTSCFLGLGCGTTSTSYVLGGESIALTARIGFDL